MAASNRARKLTHQMTFLVDEETSRAVDDLVNTLTERYGRNVSRSEAARIMLHYGTKPAKRFAGSTVDGTA